jgi:hypothetical protein
MMAFEDGFNRTVTLSRRTTATDRTFATVETGLLCRVASMKLTDVQAAEQTLGLRVSHSAMFPLGTDVRDGDRLDVTARVGVGGASEADTTDDGYLVVFIEEASGGAMGPHHVRALLSRAQRTG